MKDITVISGHNLQLFEIESWSRGYIRTVVNSLVFNAEHSVCWHSMNKALAR